MVRLCDPEPHTLSKISWDLLRPIFGVNGGLPGEKVNFTCAMPPGAMKDFPEEKAPKEDGNADIGNDEVINQPVSSGEHGKPVEDDDDGEKDEASPSSPWVADGLERKGISVDALSLERSGETDGSDTDNNPGEEIGNGNNIGEPVEYIVTSRGYGHECKEGYGGGDSDAVDWDTSFRTFKEKSGSLVDLSHSK